MRVRWRIYFCQVYLYKGFYLIYRKEGFPETGRKCFVDLFECYSRRFVQRIG